MTETEEAPVVLFEYKGPGFGVRLYKNRIEQWHSRLLWTKREAVLLRNVASVEKGAQGKVRVIDTGGKRHDFTAGFQAEKLRQAILAAL